MSWCRWGSKCTDTFPVIHKADLECKDCPGSDLYIFESCEGGIRCYGCSFLADDADTEDVRCETFEEMRAHVQKHADAGHHVRRSLLLETADKGDYVAVPGWESLLT